MTRKLRLRTWNWRSTTALQPRLKLWQESSCDSVLWGSLPDYNNTPNKSWILFLVWFQYLIWTNSDCACLVWTNLCRTFLTFSEPFLNLFWAFSEPFLILYRDKASYQSNQYEDQQCRQRMHPPVETLESKCNQDGYIHSLNDEQNYSSEDYPEGVVQLNTDVTGNKELTSWDPIGFQVMFAKFQEWCRPSKKH